MSSVKQVGNISGAVKSALNNPAIDKAVKRQVIEAAIKKTVMPTGNLALAHYKNMLSEATRFVQDSGVSNTFSGYATRAVSAPGGNGTTVTSLEPWDPLSKKYLERKRSAKMWKNTGALAGLVNLKEYGKARIGRVKIKLNSKFGGHAGIFQYDIIFNKLPDVFDTALRKSFSDGVPVDPSSLPSVPLSRSRDGVNRLIFLEKYRSGATRGGKGRPMLSAIAGALGKIMRRDLITLRQSRS